MPPFRFLLGLLLLGTLAGACPAAAQVELQQVIPALAFDRPVAIRNAANGDGRLYVVEQPGTIRTFEAVEDPQAAPLFLDISDRVFYNQVEPGLLGLAFHPDYEENGYFYVVYVTEEGEGPYRTRLSRFSRGGEPDDAEPVADPDSELILLDIPRTDWHHNGGDLHFGPDGYLYVSLGDGVCCSDPEEQGQDRTTLLGSILRLDVDDPEAGYAIPFDNPFAGNDQGWREEIWAYGFRNPWRFSIDPVTGDVLVGDVGESSWEEVNLVEAGGNYGWNTMEGLDCFGAEECETEGLMPPLWTYSHEVGLSVTGGYVYRGAQDAWLYGKYLVADWSLRKLWALEYDAGSTEPPVVTLLSDFTGLHISSFGTDEAGELYAMNTFLGTVYKVVSETITSASPSAVAPAFALRLAGPNPARTRTAVEVETGEAGPVRVSLYDVLGR
ncbi:MAG: PQQ-dependent sugar dehydrogenase, partial [Rhodothermales bacterium]|nr:PQQ-dependent sugar dehydrogenase [Rhodothermales bacterium]